MNNARLYVCVDLLVEVLALVHVLVDALVETCAKKGIAKRACKIPHKDNKDTKKQNM